MADLATGLIPRPSYTFSFVLHWRVCLGPTGSGANNNLKMKLQLCPEASLKFTLVSAILSETCQSSREAHSSLESTKNVRRSISLSLPSDSATVYIVFLPKSRSLCDKPSQNDLASGSSHTFCPKQGKISTSETSPKTCTFPTVSPNLVSADVEDIFFCSLLPPAQISFTVGFSMICSFGLMAFSLEASDALAIEITFSSVGFSFLGAHSFTCRSRILSTNLSRTMSSTGDEYSQDFTLFFKRVTN